MRVTECQRELERRTGSWWTELEVGGDDSRWIEEDLVSLCLVDGWSSCSLQKVMEMRERE